MTLQVILQGYHEKRSERFTIQYAVIDRIVDNTQVVLLLEEEGEEMVISRCELPKGIAEGTSVQIKKLLNGEMTFLVDTMKTKQNQVKSEQLHYDLRKK